MNAMYRVFAGCLFAVSVVGAVRAETPVPKTCYLFSYFVGNGEDGLHLAWSADGLKWERLHAGKSYLKPEVGESKLMRDPCLLLRPDGTFHMVWTTSWGGKTIGYASSKDLVHWSKQQAIPVMAQEPQALNCWAPEITFDDAREEYVIYWATTIPGRFPGTDQSGDGNNNHRIYATTTKDFRSFTPTRLFYDPGFNVIDATLLRVGDRYQLIVKDETKRPQAKKNLRIAAAVSAQGPFGEASAPFTPSWVEGPSALKIGDRYIVYYDCYTRHCYGASCSRDLKTWEDISAQVSFPKETRHGTALAVPGEVVQKLLQP